MSTKFCPHPPFESQKGGDGKKTQKLPGFARDDKKRRRRRRQTETIKSAPLHDFGSNGSKDKTSCGVHPTDKRIVGLSCPNACATVVFWEEAADFAFPLNPTMPPVATKPPTSKTFLVLNTALFCFFFLASMMITSSFLRRDCVSRSSVSFLNVFIVCISNARAGPMIFLAHTRDARKVQKRETAFWTNLRKREKKRTNPKYFEH